MGLKTPLRQSGIDFQPSEVPVDKSKSRNKVCTLPRRALMEQRLSEKFWRTFVTMLHERISQTTSSEEMLPTLETFDEALTAARMPRPAVVNGTVSPIDLHIGSPDINGDQAITIPIRYSKATMKARPPSLSKAWKPAMDLQTPAPPTQGASSQLASSIAHQSQQLEQPPGASDLAAMISAEVKHHSTYVIKRVAANGGKEPATSQVDFGMEGLDGEEEDVGVQEDEEVVANEDIVKAWRFGSTWVPMEADTFEPLDTRKGVEVLGFFPREAVGRVECFCPSR